MVILSQVVNYQQALDVAVQAAYQAGDLLLSEFYRPGGPRGQGGQAVVDPEAEVVIRNLLTTHFPHHGIRGEELSDLNQAPQDPQMHVWLIDPNDGTSSYLKGFRGSAVSIGLLRSGVPVLGVVYAFAAPSGQGDMFTWAEGCGPLRRNGIPVHRAAWATQLDPSHTVITSQSADRLSRAHAETSAPARFRAVPGIAYRLALVAVGEGEVAVSLNAPRDWDFAAGQALLRGVGGDLFDAFGQPITYTLDGVRPRGGRCFGGERSLIQHFWSRDWQPVYHRTPKETGPYALIEPVRDRIFPTTPKFQSVLARAQGCLLGQLTGDAYGHYVKGQDPTQVQQSSSQEIDILGKAGGTLAGQPTAASELALILARSLLHTGSFDQSQIAAAYGHWFQTQPSNLEPTLEPTFRAAAAALEAHQDPGQAAQQSANGQIQSDGALMRISPLGLLGYGIAEDTLVQWARSDAQLSHPHPVCQDANAVFVLALRQALMGQDPEQIHQTVTDWSNKQGIHADVQQWLHQASGGCPQDYTEPGRWVRIAFQNAFFQLLSAGSFEQGVRDTVRRGGDVSTNAAIAGSLLGAVYGLDGIPQRWVDRVLTCRPLAGLSGVECPRPRCAWPVDALYIAEQLLIVGQQWTASKDPDLAL